ncbi:hypothetical protein LCGC14_2478780 [marine sediment metagenome]|uniref:Uncharacterized protein n=1 Tax=marine sediment metagenome TaxID=412755 RepID=A0A0F9E1Y8_9ZZZZ
MGNRHSMTVAEMPSQGHALDLVSGYIRLGKKVEFPAGTRLSFQQPNPPPGWTKDKKHSDLVPKGFIIAVKD